MLLRKQRSEKKNLGFTLTPEGIKPGKNKLKAITDPRTSKPFAHLLASAIFSEHTLKILQSSQHHYSN
jgi:hypothetical protein